MESSQKQLYQIIGWEENFEGAKSKTYCNKSKCQMPTKHGLGYLNLIQRKNGPALFGAWCALVQVCSRHPKPRQGYCTDTGGVAGKPYTPQNLEALTRIPKNIFVELFQVASNSEVTWLRMLQGYHRDTAGKPQDTIVPLHLDLDSNSNLDSNSDLNPKIIDKKKFEDLKIRINKIYRRKETTLWNEKETKKLKDVAKRPDAIAELTEIETLYLSSGWKKFKRRDVQTFLNNWTTELDRARNPNNYEVDNDRPKSQGELALAEYKRQRDGQK